MVGACEQRGATNLDVNQRDGQAKHVELSLGPVVQVDFQDGDCRDNQESQCEAPHGEGTCFTGYESTAPAADSQKRLRSSLKKFSKPAPTNAWGPHNTWTQ